MYGKLMNCQQFCTWLNSVKIAFRYIFSSPWVVDKVSVRLLAARADSCWRREVYAWELRCASLLHWEYWKWASCSLIEFCLSMNSFKYLSFWLALSLVPAFFSARLFLLTSCCCYFCFLFQVFFSILAVSYFILFLIPLLQFAAVSLFRQASIQP